MGGILKKMEDLFNYYYGMKFRPHTLGDCPSGFLHILDSDENIYVKTKLLIKFRSFFSAKIIIRLILKN